MPTIRLNDAVGRIQQIVEERRDDGLRSPFFFIVGAGISYPPVPLAREIEQQCRERAQKYGDSAGPESNQLIDSYSHWFSKGYRSAESRQRYLRGLMEKKPISMANLRLAHLILDGTLARTVFTPNFDDMLTRALELFGQRPLVCDHPLTVGRMRIESKDIQIIHVHGSYWFYDCCNLKQEIVDQAGNAPLSLMLDQSLRDYSPLVVGYSGWDGDILMASLKRRLIAGGLGTPLYWFCYKRESMDALPPWLLKHRDVYFVVPEERRREPVADATTQDSRTGAEVPARAEIAANPDSSGVKGEPMELTAETVLGALVRQLALPSPPLTVSPLAFYADQLREFLGKHELKDTEPDTFYSFQTVISRVERARDTEAKMAPDKLRLFRDAMSKADYRGAIRRATQTNLNILSEDERRELLRTTLDASARLNDNSADEVAGYDLVLRAEATLPKGPGGEDALVLKNVSYALYNKGICLGAQGKNQEAIATYDRLLQRFGDATEPTLMEQVATAMLNKAVQLGALNRGEEAIRVYDDLLRRFRDATAPALREQVAKAIFNKGARMNALGEGEKALELYDELVDRFGEATESPLREHVAKAMLNKGVVLRTSKREEEAISVYDDLLQRFGDSTEAVIREQVAMALFNKGLTLSARGLDEKEIAVYDEMVFRFGEATEPAVREQVAKVMFNKGFTLGVLGRKDAELRAYDDLLQRFADAPEPMVREQVAKTLFSKGLVLSDLLRNEEAIATYGEIERRFGDASEPTIRRQVARGLFNRGLKLSTLGRSEEAVAAFDEVLRGFGDAPEPELREQVAKSMFNKAFSLGVLKRTDEELTLYNDLVNVFGDAVEPGLREQVAYAMFSKGARLAELGRSKEATLVYEELLDRFGADPSPALREITAKALVNYGVALSSQKRSEEEIAVYDDLLSRFGEATDEALREQVAKALLNKALTYEVLKNSELAVKTCEEMIARFRDSAAPEIMRQMDKVKSLITRLSQDGTE